MGLFCLTVKVADLSEQERKEVFKEHMKKSHFASFSKRTVSGKSCYVFCYDIFDQEKEK
jgi:hypothetical protein